LRIALAVAGSLALQGPVITWVADHRRHHAFSDKEGDPHSPWLFGTPHGAGQGLLARAHGLAVRAATRPTPTGSPRTCSPTGHRRSPLFPLWTVVSLLAARRCSAG
jgi:stearoyl-CoA desaturase (delta-9 desaturase)